MGREHGLSVDDDVSYLREFEHITRARVLPARSTDAPVKGDLDDATRLLARLLHAADAGAGPAASSTSWRCRQPPRHADHDRTAARATLQRAITLAEREGYARVFLDAGPPIASMLTALAKKATPHAYARSLATAAAGTAAQDRPGTADLIEPLSERELDVLGLLGTDLDGPAIARELTVSLSTVRTHTKHIYRKLGVNSGRAVVRRAEALSLSSRRRTR